MGRKKSGAFLFLWDRRGKRDGSSGREGVFKFGLAVGSVFGIGEGRDTLSGMGVAGGWSIGSTGMGECAGYVTGATGVRVSSGDGGCRMGPSRIHSAICSTVDRYSA